MQLEMTKKEIATLEEIRSIAKEDARRFYQMFDHSNKNKRKCTFSFFFIGFYILKLFEITWRRASVAHFALFLSSIFAS